ncbi:sensor histidine kinase [Paenibacillus sp. FSL E2-0178]|uniref:sensor histidine kinase n=1 Tax=Paenibacillus sp. FSL E2-0178 TaxID=2921361 RepID=UPI0031596C3F
MNIGRIRTWIKNQRIKKKIMLVYFPLVVIPIIALGFFSYIMNTDAIIKNTKKNVLDESRLIVMKIENVLSSSNASANILMQDLNKETKLKLIEPDESWQDELQTSDYDLLNRVEDRLDIAMMLFPEVDSAIFIDRSMHVYSTNPALITGTREGLTSPMFRVIQQSNGKNIGFPMQRRSFWVMSKGDTVYTIGKKILDLETLETIGYLFVNINEKTFELVYRSVGSLQSSVYYVIDERGNIVSSSDKNRILTPAEHGTEVGGEVSAAGTVEKSGYSDGRKILYTSTGFEQQGWRLVNETPLRELTRDSRQVSIVILVVGLICLLLAVFGAMILSKWIAAPIMSLAQYMKRINEENIDKPLEVGRGDEVGILAAGLNKMMGRIQELLNRVKNEQQKKREFELALIQEQIKPHFFYNTLDLIYVLCRSGESDEAGRATKALADFYRIALSNGKDIITLREEIQNVENYLKIQRIRYADLFDFSIEIPNELLGCKLPKLTLQPLVENSIYHGLKEKGEFGHIIITGYKQEESVCIKVSDDGIGFSLPELKQLSLNNTDKNSFGLSSVGERIRLYFGEPYGVNISSKMGEGTDVIVHIPLQMKGNG